MEHTGSVLGLPPEERKMNAEDEIVQLIEGMAGKYSPYVIFADWVKMYAIAIQNACSMQDKAWQARESQYMDVSRKYDHKEMSTFCQMNALLVDAFEREISDYLGKIYMSLGAGNKRAGQFFTPFHVSLMTARIGMADIDKEWIEENGIKLNEPSVGGGGMVLATAQVIQDKGANYQKCLDVVAQDLDWNGVYMTYVQLSLTGIKAKVIQGNTLEESEVNAYPRERTLRTPARMGALL